MIKLFGSAKYLRHRFWRNTASTYDLGHFPCDFHSFLLICVEYGQDAARKSVVHFAGRHAK